MRSTGSTRSAWPVWTLGVLGHEGSTVIVGLNGLRLLRDAAWNRAATKGRTP